MNKQFIEQMKAQRALVKKNIEEIYSAMCVVLHKKGMSDDDIILILVDRGWAELKDDVKGKGKK